MSVPSRPSTAPTALPTVFLSYRRDASRWLADKLAAVLKARGYDVFLDEDSMRGGRITDVLHAEIACRDCFVVILSKDSLRGIRRRRDWLRMEIAHALRYNRTIVPVFDGQSPLTRRKLPHDLADLADWDGVEIRRADFDEKVSRLCGDYLRKPAPPPKPLIRTPAPELSRKASLSLRAGLHLRPSRSR